MSKHCCSIMLLAGHLASGTRHVWSFVGSRHARRDHSGVVSRLLDQLQALQPPSSFSVTPPVPPGNAAPLFHARGFQTSCTRLSIAQNTAMDIFDRHSPCPPQASITSQYSVPMVCRGPNVEGHHASLACRDLKRLHRDRAALLQDPDDQLLV